MPKYRKLPVTVLDSLDVTEMPDDFTRLTWLLLPLVVCRHGRAFDVSQWLVSKLYPARTDVDASMVAQAMEWFASHDMIRRYNVNGRHYFYLTNWEKHQGDTGREADSPYPAPPEGTASRPVMTNSRVTHEQVTTNSRSKQGNSKGNSKSKSNAAAVARGHPGASVASEDAAAAAYLRQFGIAYNATTAPIAELDEEYIRGHLDYATRQADTTGLAIRRMLDGDPVPRDPSRRELDWEIPAEYRDIVQR